MTSFQRIRRTQSGDQAAFDELYAWLLPEVYRYAWAQVGNQGAAEEITSETFLAFVSKLDEMPEDDQSVLAWMRVVARNKSVDWVRRQQNQRQAMAAIANVGGSLHTKASSAPSHHFESQERCQLVHVVLEKLRDEYRQVLELQFLDGLSVIAIADVIGATPSATTSLLYRARQSFRSEHRRLLGVADTEPRSNATTDGSVS